eukprot:6492044-Amphidinium_carterae.1
MSSCTLCCSKPQIDVASPHPSEALASTYASRSLSFAGAGPAWLTVLTGSGTGSSGKARSSLLPFDYGFVHNLAVAIHFLRKLLGSTQKAACLTGASVVWLSCLVSTCSGRGGGLVALIALPTAFSPPFAFPFGLTRRGTPSGLTWRGYVFALEALCATSKVVEATGSTVPPIAKSSPL